MARQIIFSDSIITDVLSDEKLKKEILTELKEQENLNKGNFLTNHGGFQSKSISNKYISETILLKVTENLINYYKFKKVKLNLSNMWINKNNKGDFNIIHTHTGSHFSGVYYVDVPKEKGELIFYRSNAGNFCNLNDFLTNNNNNDTEVISSFNIYPQNDMLIIFRSYLPHFVMPHQSDRARISISFNVNLENG